MTTPGVPVDLYSYCLLLQSEITRLTDRLEYGTPAPPPAPPSPGPTFHGVWDGSRWVLPTIPAPTPAVIAAAHTSIPLAETFPPTAPDTVTRFSCTLVVPDSAVGHIVGRGGKGLHQAHDTSGAQLRQIGEALIALGKRFMRKRVRAKKQRQPPSAEGPAPPPPVAPVPASHATKMDVDRAPHRSSTVPRGQSQVPRAPTAARPAAHPRASTAARRASWAFATVFSPLPVYPTPVSPAAATTQPIRAAASTLPTPQPNPTPFAPSVAMGTPSTFTRVSHTQGASPMRMDTSVASTPMQIDAVAHGRQRNRQTAQRGAYLRNHRVL
ncbi:hypothetical protein MIND_00900500 [Mycena indigotica]|uniref:K Homology domain-containing protein n=1 Tax=Mycena indigotica TaxID=2126181 RepID=A0A8H6VZ49_9AGAR|nr:uncharacterized protein MIND_00900500 [Mycena indigotica]KAF7299504.1 hypothetical protein MIND_00900500 [Mycena indigotica]